MATMHVLGCGRKALAAAIDGANEEGFEGIFVGVALVLFVPAHPRESKNELVARTKLGFVLWSFDR